jgi:hypothetical protein
VALLVGSVGCTEMTLWKEQQLRSLKPDTHERKKNFLAALYFVIRVESSFFTMKEQTVPCEVQTYFFNMK